MDAELAGLLLAGGASTRFGSDKALAVVDGRTLLERGVACLREVCDGPVVVASGAGTAHPGVADGQVVDLLPDAGPLSALAGGLPPLAEHATAVAVLAVDHVHPSAALLRLLADARGSAACAVAEVAGRLQPLHAVWATAAADEVVAAVRDGQRSVVDWLRARDDVRVVAEADLRRAGMDPTTTRDADVPEDLPG